MQSKPLRISRVLLLSSTLALTACAPKVIAPSIELTLADRTPAEDPAKPRFAALPKIAPGSPEAAERARILAAIVKPLAAFSLEQEKTTAAERQRADGLVAKIDKHREAVTPRHWWRLW